MNPAATRVRRPIVAWSFFLVAALLGSAAQAQTYPSKAVRLIVPTGAGGSNDLVGRAIGAKLSEMWKQTVLIENKPGATGSIGIDLVAKSPPDGYTIGVVASTFASNASMGAKLPFDPLRDLIAVTQIATASWVLVSNPSLPANNMAELIALAKKRPGQINYGSTGEGGAIHLAGELLNKMAGIKLKHIPYKGTVQAMNDVIGGQIELTITSTPPAMQQVLAGKLRVLGVTGLGRSKQVPNIPAISETVPGYESTNWFGVLAPRGTPPEIVATIRNGVVSSLASKEVAQLFAVQGLDAVGSTTEQFTEKVRTNIDTYSKLARELGLRKD